MDLSYKRNEEYFLNKYDIDNLTEVNDRVIRFILNNKYLTLRANNIDFAKDKLEILFNNNIDIAGKIITLEIVDGCYLTLDQCEKAKKMSEAIQQAGAEFKVLDGNFWDLEDVIAAASALDDIVNKINSATVEENGHTRPLNELEKFLWAYSYTANRKYKVNLTDLSSPRKITSIIKTKDCVCVGFATILHELCTRLNIECHMNSCQVQNKDGTQELGGHHNNLVVINNQAFYCDSCWDCVPKIENGRRTFCHCLIPFEDEKLHSVNYSFSDPSAPFVDIVADEEEIRNALDFIQSKEELSSEEYSQLFVYNSAPYIYRKYIQDKKGNNINFSNSYKDEALFYLNEGINLIKSRKIKNPMTIEDFEKAIYNIYRAIGNSEETAREKTYLDIETSINTAGCAFLPDATNCFAQAYYNKLEV